MKRFTLALALLAAVVVMPTPVQAHKGHARPQITRLEFVNRPLRSGTLERVVVVAHDPNSWISEIQIQWEDPNDMGGVVFAHTYCVQDPEFTTPGTPAKLKIDLTFDHPETYVLRARAISNKRCEGGNDTRISETVKREIVVKDPTETFSDPDDTAGPLDVLGGSHSQYGDEAGLRTHVTHGFTFSEDLGTAPLAGSGDYVELLFDTDDTAGTFERTLTVDAVGGSLQAEMTDSSGKVIGEAAVATEGATLTVDLVKGLLGRGVERYRWVALTHDSSSQACTQVACEDRAPDAQAYVHRL